MILQESYDRGNFQAFLHGFLPDYRQEIRPVVLPVNSLINSMNQLGSSEDFDLLVFEAEVDEGNSARRIGVTQNVFRVLRETQTDSALIAFHHGNTWRLSLLRTFMKAGCFVLPAARAASPISSVHRPKQTRHTSILLTEEWYTILMSYRVAFRLKLSTKSSTGRFEICLSDLWVKSRKIQLWAAK